MNYTFICAETIDLLSSDVESHVISMAGHTILTKNTWTHVKKVFLKKYREKLLEITESDAGNSFFIEQINRLDTAIFFYSELEWNGPVQPSS